MAKSSRKRRRDAWGSITEVERGKRYRIRYWAKDGESGYRRKSVTVRGTRKDAERKRSELMLDHSEDAPCPTVAYLWDKWALPAYERRVNEGDMSHVTLANYKSSWKGAVSPRWGDVPCDSIAPLAVQQWLDGLARNKAVAAMNMVRPLMDYAVRYGIVASNPFREKYLMPSASTVSRADSGVWSLDDLGTVWRDAVHGSWIEAAFLLAGFGGMRVGESLGVRSEDVSAVEVGGQTVCMVRVERQVDNRSREVTDRLKSQKSRRQVAIPGGAGARLLALAPDADGGWLTSNGFGGNSTQRMLQKEWRKLMRSLPEDLRHPFKNLRNSWETNCRWTVGIRPYYIESAMGHAGKSVTDFYYDRPSPEQIASAFSSAWSDYLEKNGGVDPIS